MLLLRRIYVQPGARRRFRSGARTGRSSLWSGQNVHNWELCIMADSRRKVKTTQPERCVNHPMWVNFMLMGVVLVGQI